MGNTRLIRRLVLVFDASSGKLSAWVDSARKIFRLKGCALCSITHGLAGEKDDWKDCQAELGVPVEYLHRDELVGDLKALVGDRMPCVVAETDDEPLIILTPEALERCRGSVNDFKGRLLTHAAMNDLEIPDSE